MALAGCLVCADVAADSVGEAAWAAHFDVGAIAEIPARMQLLPVAAHGELSGVSGVWLKWRRILAGVCVVNVK